MCLVMCVDMCVDMGVDMGVGMRRNGVSAMVLGAVYAEAFLRVCVRAQAPIEDGKQ